MAYIALALVILFWGSAGAVATKVNSGLEPLLMALTRNIIGFVTLLLLIIIQRTIIRERTHIYPKPAFKSYISLWISGFFGFGLMMWLFFQASQMTLASHLVLILSLAPLCTMLLERLAGGNPLPVQRVIAAAVSLIGIFIIVFPSFLSGRNMWAGDLTAFGSLVSFSIFSHQLNRLKPYFNPLPANLHAIAAGTLFLLLVAFIDKGSSILSYISAFDEINDSLPALLYLGICSTGAAYFLYAWTMNKLPFQNVILSLYLQPIAGILIARIWLKEPIYESFILGSILVLAGLVMAQLKYNKRSKELTPNG